MGVLLWVFCCGCFVRDEVGGGRGVKGRDHGGFMKWYVICAYMYTFTHHTHHTHHTPVSVAKFPKDVTRSVGRPPLSVRPLVCGPHTRCTVWGWLLLLLLLLCSDTLIC